MMTLPTPTTPKCITAVQQMHRQVTIALCTIVAFARLWLVIVLNTLSVTAYWVGVVRRMREMSGCSTVAEEWLF